MIGRMDSRLRGNDTDLGGDDTGLGGDETLFPDQHKKSGCLSMIDRQPHVACNQMKKVLT